MKIGTIMKKIYTIYQLLNITTAKYTSLHVKHSTFKRELCDTYSGC